MKRDISRDPAYQFVRVLTLSRLACGLVLPLLGWWQLWVLAAVAFVLAFLTDMLDGELARAWNVATKSGARLDPLADLVLTFGALLAMVLGDGWSGFILVLLVAAYVVRGWLMPRLHGDALGLLIMAVPVANLLLTALLSARFVQLASGVSYSVLLSLVVVVGTLLVCLKRHRIADFARMAIARSMD